MCDYVEPSCVIVKHTNPCGVATRTDLLEAYRLAVRRQGGVQGGREGGACIDLLEAYRPARQ